MAIFKTPAPPGLAAAAPTIDRRRTPARRSLTCAWSVGPDRRLSARWRADDPAARGRRPSSGRA